jgi:hypothetical protein
MAWAGSAVVTKSPGQHRAVWDFFMQLREAADWQQDKK